MDMKTVITRVPAALVDQVDAIAARRQAAMQRATRSDLVREALVRLVQGERAEARGGRNAPRAT